MFTSANLGEGSSLVVSELAIAEAISPNKKKPVLFIDLNSFHSNGSADLLDRELSKDTKGITDLLQGIGKLEDCLHSTKIPNLYVMPYGTPESDFDPVSYLAPLRTLIKEKLSQFRILIDICNLSARNRANFDPVEVAQIADKVILVVLTNVTPKQTISHSKVEIESYGGTVSGIIMNDYQTVSFMKDFKKILQTTKGTIADFFKNRALPFLKNKLSRRKMVNEPSAD